MIAARARLALLAVAVALAAAAPAHAEDPCVPDAKRLCKDVPYGEGRVVDCLREHWYQVSGACQQRVRDADNRAQQVSAACGNDVFQHCARTPTGSGRVLRCLAGHWDALSTTCRDAVGEIAERAKRFTDACSADAARLCQAIEPGGGRIYACLKFQERAVSSRCADALRP